MVPDSALKNAAPDIKSDIIYTKNVYFLPWYFNTIYQNTMFFFTFFISVFLIRGKQYAEYYHIYSMHASDPNPTNLQI